MRFLRYFAGFVGVAASLVHALPAGPNDAGPSSVDPFETYDFKLDVDSKSSAKYENFIRDFRIRARSGVTGGAGIPILPPQQETPTKFFDVLLTTTEDGKTYKLMVKLRRDNLYIIAHRNEGGWMELSDSKYVTGATPLDFGGRYGGRDSLGAYANYPNTNAREQTICGKGPLSETIKQLSSKAYLEKIKKLTPNEVQARAYLVLTQMLSESIRLTDVSNYMAQNWASGAAPTPDLVGQENGWSAFSENVNGEEARKKLAIALNPEKEQRSGMQEETNGKGKSTPNGKKNCKRDFCNTKLGPDEPKTKKAGSPKVGLTKSAALQHFGGVAFNLAWMASNCMKLEDLPEPTPMPEPGTTNKTLWEKIQGITEVPSLLWGSLQKLWAPENVVAFKKSFNDLGRAFSEVPDAVKNGINDLTNTENLDAFVKSFSDLKRGASEIPGVVASGMEDLVKAENMDAFANSVTKLGQGISEIPGALESGLSDLEQAPGDIAAAFQKAPQQLARAAQDFIKEFNKYFPPGSNKRKIFDSLLASVPIGTAPLKTLGQRIGMSVEEITAVASVACIDTKL